MSSTNLKTRIALKIDTALNWSSSELILMKGEIGIESDTGKFKIGDGVKRFSALSYAAQKPTVTSTENPLTSDTGYEVGQLWINTTTGSSFILQSNEPNPNWIQLAKHSDIQNADFGDMKKEVYDTNSDGSVDKADSLKSGDSFLTINDGATDGLWTASKTKTELDAKADKLTTYTKEEVNSALGAKADKSTTYSKDDVNGLLANKANTSDLSNYVPTSQKGAASGVATLDESGKIPTSQLPSYVSDVIEAANMAAFPETGEPNKIYVALDTNKTYRWSGSTYVEISASLVIGTASGTAYDGAAGKANADAITELQSRVGEIESSTGSLGALAKKDTVAEADIDANAITESKIADGSVSGSKLATNAVTESKIADSAVTDAKIVTVSASKLTQQPADYLVLNCGNATA